MYSPLTPRSALWQREKDRNAKLCVRMTDKSTTLVSPEDGKEKTFTFDFVYWSHDG